MSQCNPSLEAELDALQRASFSYFEHEINPRNGLVADKTAQDWPASIAATGFALAAYPVGVERGFISRAAAVERTLRTLRFFSTSPHGPEPDATGFQGFYYHFLDMQTGRRAGQCGLSTVDTAFLLAGALTAAAYFDAPSVDEKTIRTTTDALYRRANWPWAQNGGATLTHGWKPESGFLQYRWEGYDEALLLYMLALGSPTHPLADTEFLAWCSTYQWKSHYGYDYLYAGSLFTHQLSHIWIDFREIQATDVTAGELAQAMVPGPKHLRLTGSSGSSSIISRAEYRSDPMTAPGSLGDCIVVALCPRNCSAADRVFDPRTPPERRQSVRVQIDFQCHLPDEYPQPARVGITLALRDRSRPNHIDD
jgi:hypothetical protein